MPTRVLCLVPTGFEEIELITPVDLLRRAGAEVILAHLGPDRSVTGRCGVTIQTDAALDSLDPSSFSALLLPGGPGVKSMREDRRAARLAREFHDSQRIVAAICAAPTVLHDADLLAGRRFTAHSSVHPELPGVAADQRVVEDGFLITSRGAGTALDFALALVRRLFTPAKSTEIAQSIMA